MYMPRLWATVTPTSVKVVDARNRRTGEGDDNVARPQPRDVGRTSRLDGLREHARRHGLSRDAD